MTNVSEKAAIGISSAILATGIVTAFQPPSPDPDERRAQQHQRDLDQAADARELENEENRRRGVEHGEAEQSRRQVPAVHTPRPRVRIPLP